MSDVHAQTVAYVAPSQIPPSPPPAAAAGTSDISRGQSYMEDPLRMVSHLIMSTPEYQIN